MSGILFGLLGGSFIGVSDCVARFTAQRTSLSVLILFVMGFSTTLMTIWFIALGDWPRWHLYSWSASMLSGFLNLGALLFLYRALARGPVSVASPAASTFSVMLVALNALAGEPFSWQQIASVFIVFIGIAMLARPSTGSTVHENYSPAWLRTTALLGLGTGVCISLRFFFAQEAVVFLGPIHSLYLNRLAALSSVILLMGWEQLNQKPRNWPSGPVLKLVILQSLLEMLALGAFLCGSTGDGRVGASIGFSAFSAVTALSAWIWLKERVDPHRILWIAIIIGAIWIAILYAP